MTIWTYIRVIMTPPGFVRDHVAISQAPVPPKEEYHPPHTLYPNTEVNSQDQDISSETAQIEPQSEEPISPTLPAIIGPLGASQVAKADEEKAILSDEGQHVPQSNIAPYPAHQTIAPTPHDTQQTNNNNNNNNGTLAWIQEPCRVPPQSSPLHPDNLYCYRCKRVKPPRAHHCRRCASCVLKMDHHCPWVGGCVGARNHKYFYHFLQWVTLLEVFTLLVNSIVFSRGIQRRAAGGGQGWSIDGYMISLFPM